MKKILTLLGSFGLIASTSVSVTSCGCSLGWLNGLLSSECYDENWTNIGDDESNSDQWSDILSLVLFIGTLSKSDFPDSKTLIESIDHQTSKEIEEKYLSFENEDGKKENFHFKLNFTFLITNYESISWPVINEMQKNLLSQKTEESMPAGNYLFINLANLKNPRENLEKEKHIEFDFLFLTKEENGNIRNNENNYWYYWYQYDCYNRYQTENDYPYFFDLKEYASYKRVVTWVPFFN